ncbi:MAG: Nrap protein-domain-containing protein [Piptocephalis tieghemiana]|nr:MAG: Nrap protein-domain-containing protein [Piptocephalis tieghemiana]
MPAKKRSTRSALPSSSSSSAPATRGSLAQEPSPTMQVPPSKKQRLAHLSSSSSSSSSSSTEDEEDHIESSEEDEPLSSSPAPIKASSTRGFTGDALYKPPTAEEMFSLQETSNLFASNLFRLQMDELLKEVTVPAPGTSSTTRPLDLALRSLKDILLALPSVATDSEPLGLSLSETLHRAETHLDGVSIPFPAPGPPEDAQYRFAFAPPTAVRIIGSYALGHAVRSSSAEESFAVDVAIEMPEDLFREKDRLNHRYFHKRAYYLAEVAAALAKSDQLAIHPSFSHAPTLHGEGDARRPILELRGDRSGAPTDFSSLGCLIRLYPTIDPSLFPRHHLALDRNNVRPITDDPLPPSLPPTPLYNASLLQDTLMTSHLAYLYSRAKSSPAFGIVGRLGRVWIHQHALPLSPFLWDMLLAWRISGSTQAYGLSPLPEGLSAYQLFKGFMDFLSTFPLASQTLDMSGQAPSSLLPESERTLRILDPSGSLNLAAHLTRTQYAHVQYIAAQSMRMLQKSSRSEAQFETLFLRPCRDPYMVYDWTLHVPPAHYALHPVRDVDNLARPLTHQVRRVEAILLRALTDRSSYAGVQLIRSQGNHWPITSSPSSSFHSIRVGIRWAGEAAYRVIDKGPSPSSNSGSKVEEGDQEAAAERYRAFWGAKSELRRFKDGRICESVVWSQVTEEAEVGVSNILRYILAKHMALSPGDIRVVEGGVRRQGLINQLLGSFDTSLRPWQPVTRAYDGLVKAIRNMEGLPLAVASVQAASPALAYTSIRIPQGEEEEEEDEVNKSGREGPMEIVVRFEELGAWPEGDLRAIRETQVAILLAMRVKLLRGGIEAPTGARWLAREATVEVTPKELVGQGKEILTSPTLLITSPEGFLFRIRIREDRERALLLAQGDQAKAEAMLWEEACIHRVQSVFRGRRACQQWPGLSRATRLVKRWLSSHLLLSTVVPESWVEGLCRSVYAGSGQLDGVRVDGWAGFLEVLDALARWDWRAPSEAMIDSYGQEELEETEEDQAKALREGGGGEEDMVSSGVLAQSFLEGRDGLQGTIWGKRVGALAKASLSLLNSKGQEKSVSPTVEGMFKTPLTDFDILLHIKEEWAQADQAFDPVSMLIQEIKVLYGDIAYVLYDTVTPRVIALLWRRMDGHVKPYVSGAQGRWHVRMGINALVPLSSDNQGKAQLNEASILGELCRLGQGLIERVEGKAVKK